MGLDVGTGKGVEKLVAKKHKEVSQKSRWALVEQKKKEVVAKETAEKQWVEKERATKEKVEKGNKIQKNSTN